MKVAFATTDLETINDHFGWAKQFAIYEVNPEGYTCLGAVKTEEEIQEEDDKINAKISALKGVSIIYCEAIGPTAAARVVQSRMHPMKVSTPTPIGETLDSLVKMLDTNPPPWIRRILAMEANNG
jgi:nitrogen fixation protein NifX